MFCPSINPAWICTFDDGDCCIHQNSAGSNDTWITENEGNQQLSLSSSPWPSSLWSSSLLLLSGACVARRKVRWQWQQTLELGRPSIVVAAPCCASIVCLYWYLAMPQPDHRNDIHHHHQQQQQQHHQHYHVRRKAQGDCDSRPPMHEQAYVVCCIHHNHSHNHNHNCHHHHNYHPISNCVHYWNHRRSHYLYTSTAFRAYSVCVLIMMRSRIIM